MSSLTSNEAKQLQEYIQVKRDEVLYHYVEDMLLPIVEDGWIRHFDRDQFRVMVWSFKVGYLQGSKLFSDMEILPESIKILEEMISKETSPKKLNLLAQALEITNKFIHSR